MDSSEVRDFIGNVAIKALIVKNERVLLVRDHHDESLWEFPGGHVGVDESIESALERELMEELGVRASMGRLIHSEQLIHSNRGTPHLFIICTAILVPPDQSMNVPSEEIAEVRWVDQESVKSLKLYKETKNALDAFWRSQQPLEMDL